MTKLSRFIIPLMIAMLIASIAMAGSFYSGLSQGQNINGFKVENIYLNGQDKEFGARFLHEGTGFTLDLFEIQSVPQGFIWVYSPPADDRGEPHTCEHLLLGKGTKGRYVASLEDMSLGKSTAYTSQIYTAYPFSSEGGDDIFFDLFEAKMDALMHPNYTDEEIRREVCNIGVTEDPATGQLGVEEKGTVYNEMVSSFEKHWYWLYGTLDEMVYGKDHPLSNNSGGRPDAIREMVPQNLRDFQEGAYTLNNMGIIITIPANITPDRFLARIDKILTRLYAVSGNASKQRVQLVLPPPQPDAKPGEIRMTSYPGSNPQDPGNIAYAWPANLDLTLRDQYMLEIFLYSFGDSQTSNLYNKFVNSQTRAIDIGASDAWMSVDDNIGHSIYMGISDVDPKEINSAQIANIRSLVKDEIKDIASYADGSAELEDFNNRCINHVKQQQKEYESYLNGPPGFGLRGGNGGRWYGLIRALERTDGFVKSMVRKEDVAYALDQLGKHKNIWTDLIKKWKLLDNQMYGVGCKADPSMLSEELEAKEKRLDAFVAGLREKYNVADDNTAIAHYKEEYDANSAVIDSAAATIAMPGFLKNPPMSFDPMLDYEVISVSNRVPLVASTFNTMTSSTIGIAFDLHVVPGDKLIYIPMLRSLITDIGVVRDGQAIDFSTLSEKLKEEVLSLNASFTSNPFTDRVELQVVGAGGDLEESKRVLGWMQTCLAGPWLDTANLSRIRDVVDSRISGLRNTMKRSEEAWVQDPAAAYRFQNNPIYLAGDCFLTQEHFMHRLKWRLTDPGGSQTARECEMLFEPLAAAGRTQSRETLLSFAKDFSTADPAAFESGPFGEFVRTYLTSDAEAQDILLEALSDLSEIVPDIPEASAGGDWEYLCNQMKNDLLYRPEKALNELKETLAMLLYQSNARMFIISNAADRAGLTDNIQQLVSSLNDAPKPAAPKYAARNIMLERMQSRYGDIGRPTYIGLVNNNTRNGVFIYSEKCVSLENPTENQLMDYLAAKLYGGGGAHSMFMKTWSAGLAYSNGLRSGETDGMLVYYAERCPDLSQTMRFVVDELKKAPYDPKLAEYSVAQTFLSNRGSNSYESRGRAMAANLADGITPEKVAAFRQRILELRKRSDLYDVLHARMNDVYGRVLVGLGENLTKIPDGNYFIIGPPAQFASVEEMITSADGKPETVYKLYPRDYWITN